jgi:hypothetical protein
MDRQVRGGVTTFVSAFTAVYNPHTNLAPNITSSLILWSTAATYTLLPHGSSKNEPAGDGQPGNGPCKSLHLPFQMFFVSRLLELILCPFVPDVAAGV